MPAEIATRPVVYRMPCMDDVIVRHEPAMDLYYPPGTRGETPLPVVLFVMGYPESGTRQRIGCSAREMASYICWARLVATFGMVGVTYSVEQPEVEVHDLLRDLRARADALGIDADRLGVWACSGHVPVALSLLMSEAPGIACATLLYGYVGRPAGDVKLPGDLPLLIVRAGRDEMPGLNAELDALVASALAANLPLTVINHHTAPHAFDILDDSDASRQVVMRTLAFLQMQLRPAMMAIGQKKPGLDAR